MYFLALKGQFKNLTSDQVRSRSGHDPSRSKCISSEAPWRAKSFGTICASISLSCRDLLVKNGLWPHLTSGDLPMTSDRQLHPDHHRWGEWPWSGNNWVVSVGLRKTGNIFIFLHRPLMGRLRNLPDLRSPGQKFWDIHFMVLMTSSNPVSFILILPTWTVAMARLPFFKEGSWPDQTLGKNFTECSQNECPLKARKFRLPISSRLAMTHTHKNKRARGLLKPPPLHPE